MLLFRNPKSSTTVYVFPVCSLLVKFTGEKNNSMKVNVHNFTMAALLIFLHACDHQQGKEQFNQNSSTSNIPKNMYDVTPVSNTNGQEQTLKPKRNSSGSELTIGQGQFFSYALPQGWRLGEDGQFALTLVAPDNNAFTVMVGNSGYMPDYQPGQFIYEKMMALSPANLQIGAVQKTTPVHGFQYAYSFPVGYNTNGKSYRGMATCHVSPYYGGSVMAMTAAITESSQWDDYQHWLPAVSRQISASNGAAFGMRGLMQQNLRNSMSYAVAAKAYREWSAQKQQELTDYRNDMNDKQQEEVRDNLGAVQRYNDPYNNGKEVQLSTQYQYYWMDKSGRILGTNDVNVDPNNGGTGNWAKMETKRY